MDQLIRSSGDGVVLNVTSPLTPPTPATFAATTASHEPFAQLDEAIRVNGDHVTQIVLQTPESLPATLPGTPASGRLREQQEDRELGESWAHFGTPIRLQNHITAVSVNDVNDANDANDANDLSDDESTGSVHSH